MAYSLTIRVRRIAVRAVQRVDAGNQDRVGGRRAIDDEEHSDGERGNRGRRCQVVPLRTCLSLHESVQLARVAQPHEPDFETRRGLHLLHDVGMLEIVGLKRLALLVGETIGEIACDHVVVVDILSIHLTATCSGAGVHLRRNIPAARPGGPIC